MAFNFDYIWAAEIAECHNEMNKQDGASLEYVVGTEALFGLLTQLRTNSLYVENKILSWNGQ